MDGAILEKLVRPKDLSLEDLGWGVRTVNSGITQKKAHMFVSHLMMLPNVEPTIRIYTSAKPDAMKLVFKNDNDYKDVAIITNGFSQKDYAGGKRHVLSPGSFCVLIKRKAMENDPSEYSYEISIDTQTSAEELQRLAKETLGTVPENFIFTRTKKLPQPQAV